MNQNGKLNGFNNGRDTADGVGGDKPFHELMDKGTLKKVDMNQQETKTVEKVIIERINELKIENGNLIIDYAAAQSDEQTIIAQLIAEKQLRIKDLQWAIEQFKSQPPPIAESLHEMLDKNFPLPAHGRKFDIGDYSGMKNEELRQIATKFYLAGQQSKPEPQAKKPSDTKEIYLNELNRRKNLKNLDKSEDYNSGYRKGIIDSKTEFNSIFLNDSHFPQPPNQIDWSEIEKEYINYFHHSSTKLFEWLKQRPEFSSQQTTKK